MKHPSRLLALTALAVLVLAFAACAPAATPTPGSSISAPPTAVSPTQAAPTSAATQAAPTSGAQTAPTAASGNAPVTISVAYSTLNPDPLPLWVAQDEGFFKKNGLDVNLLFVNGGTQTAQALISGSVKFAATAPAAAVNADAGGADLVAVAGLVNVINYDFIAQPGIKTAADLKGKKVAWSGPSGSSATALKIALKVLFNLDITQVVPVTIGTEPEREAAMVSKQIDATVINPDLAIKAQKDGLVVLGELWKRKDIPYQHTGIVASKAYLKANPDVANRFFESIIQAIGYIRDPANKTQTIAILGKYLKSTDQPVLESGYTRMSGTLLQCVPYVTLEGMKTVISESPTATKKGLTAEQLTDNSFLQTLDQNGFAKANCK
ncbi:MAG: ABC transporter substrate-binding protein [Chloroflexi bacterium]|nr:ABC transporter substrate-binding protein [Chloroflexota bacterium]